MFLIPIQVFRSWELSFGLNKCISKDFVPKDFVAKKLKSILSNMHVDVVS